MNKKPMLMWVGDHSCESGFARASHETLAVLHTLGWDIVVIAVNYFGDPGTFPYPVYPAWCPGGDGFGLKRIGELAEKYQPDVVLIQNDPWNIKAYLKKLKDYGGVKAASMPVDGKNCSAADTLNELDLSIFWTKFGEKEAREGGFTGESTIIPLGVHREIFHHGNKLQCRQAMQLPEQTWDAFIVGNVNRNQPRKRLDLTVDYFCTWVKNYGVKDAFLYMHICPTGDMGWDLYQLMKYYGLEEQLILSDVGVRNGFSDQTMVALYNSFDVQMTTTLGEGWGLPALEGMSCGVANLGPDWSALGDWAKGAMELVPCTTFSATPNFVNVIGGVADKAMMIDALHKLYSDKEYRHSIAKAGYELAKQEQFRWQNIGNQFDIQLKAAIERKSCQLLAT